MAKRRIRLKFVCTNPEKPKLHPAKAYKFCLLLPHGGCKWLTVARRAYKVDVEAIEAK